METKRTTTNLVEKSASPTLGIVNAEAIMLQVQIYIVQDLSREAQFVGEQLKLISKVKKQYRDQLNVIKNTLSKKNEKNKHNGQQIIKLTPQESAEVLHALNEVEFNLEQPELGFSLKSFKINDSGDGHEANDRRSDSVSSLPQIPLHDSDGKIDSGAWGDYFDELAKLGKSKSAREIATEVGGDKSTRFFYADRANHAFEDGTPRLSFFVDGLQAQLDIMENKMMSADEQAQELATKLNRLIEQRKEALENVAQIQSKTSQINEHALSAGGAL